MATQPDSWQYPAAILATVGVIAAVFRAIRSWSRREKIIEDHTKLLKECTAKNTVSHEDCENAQTRCQERQDANNNTLLDAIKELKDSNKEKDAQRHEEMMKMAQSLGRIEGAIGRHHVS